MSSVTASGVRGALARASLAAGIAVVAAMGTALPAHATAAAGVDLPLGPPVFREDPGCDYFGWRHPLCAGGAFDDGTPGDNAAAGGIPAPSMVPNIDGTLSLPGTPGAI